MSPDFVYATHTWQRLAVGVLATWRVTHLVAHEDGPADIIFRLRAWLGRRAVGRLMDCFNCLSVWVALPISFFVASGAVNVVMAWLALSGAACLLQRLGHQPLEIHPVAPVADHATSGIGGVDGLLRSEESQSREPAK